MTNPVFKCPHCKGSIELELTEKGLLKVLKKGAAE